jgi:hypothetical protein
MIIFIFMIVMLIIGLYFTYLNIEVEELINRTRKQEKLIIELENRNIEFYNKNKNLENKIKELMNKN